MILDFKCIIFKVYLKYTSTLAQSNILSISLVVLQPYSRTIVTFRHGYGTRRYFIMSLMTESKELMIMDLNDLTHTNDV